MRMKLWLCFSSGGRAASIARYGDLIVAIEGRKVTDPEAVVVVPAISRRSCTSSSTVESATETE